MLPLLLSMLLTILSSQPHMADDDPFTIFSEPLVKGEAQIIYLFHSGWLVRTQSKVLIFDYSLPRMPPGVQQRPEAWNINPERLKNFDVVVFTSHNHSDHYNPVILGWREVISKITYVFGWQFGKDEHFICCDFEREKFEIDGILVQTVVHNWDGMSESAFLISVDGLTLYHAGDHSTASGKELFADNLNYLHSLAPNIDIAFTPTWGGEDVMISILKPRYTFPMHNGGSERQHSLFKEKADRLNYPTIVIVAQRSGAAFLYEGGKIRPH